MGNSVTNYTAPPTTAKFMQSSAPVRLAMGPVGSGKTVGICMEIARRSQEQAPNRQGIRKTRWAVVRNTQQQLRDTILKTWLEWFPDGVAGTWREYDKTFFLRFGDVDAEILFRALDSPEDVNRLLSLELTGGVINEAREIPIEIVTALRSRCGRYPSRKEGGPTWHGVIMDTNPPSTDHWIHDKFEDEKPDGWEIFKQPSGLSPEAENIENLPPGYYDEMMTGASAEWIKVHVHGQYGRSQYGRPVYEDAWSTEFHTATGLQIIRSAPVVIGLDAGRTPAATFFQKDAKGRVLQLDEVIGENIGMENFLANMVKPLLFERYLNHRVVVGADPSVWDKSQINETSVADMVTAAGFVMSRRVDTSNRLPPRLQAVESLLGRTVKGEPMFLVDRDRCPVTVAGFEHGYRYKKKRDGSFELSPEKNRWSHPHDSIQYGAQVVDHATELAGIVRGAREVERASMAGWT